MRSMMPEGSDSQPGVSERLSCLIGLQSGARSATGPGRASEYGRLRSNGGMGCVDATTVMVVVAIGYFVVFGLGFLVQPALVERFALRWTDAAGRTEVRCYYGALSIAIGGVLALALAEDQVDLALSAVLILAVSVLSTRLIATAAEGGWQHSYNRLAIPAETAMVLVLGAVKIFG